ncbi:MAG: hypothetical protein L3J09_11105 [Flavobacteriaceae bacterium]|nr:hypothetical protein [Flavobacteriaceae bacterium]
MKTLKTYITFGIALVIFSCQTETDYINTEINKENTILLKYRTLFKSNKPSGSIAIQSNGTGIGDKTTRRITLSKKEGNNKKSLQVFNDKNSKIRYVNHKHDSNLKDLFGKNIYFGMSSQKNLTDSLYIPQELTVNFSSNELSAGAIVNWNADNLNTNGVVINVVYDPLLQQNGVIAWENQFRIKESFAVEEGNGTYQITQQDIDRFPQDAYVTIKVSRGAFSINEEEPAIIAVTSVRNEIKVDKE